MLLFSVMAHVAFLFVIVFLYTNPKTSGVMREGINFKTGPVTIFQAGWPMLSCGNKMLPIAKHPQGSPHDALHHSSI